MAKESVADKRRREFAEECAIALGLNAVEKKLTFREFVNKVKPKYKWYRHCEALADVLQKVADGELNRAMIFMPPRHGKSELATRLFPAYYLYRYPERFVGINSYSADLAKTFSRAARDAFWEAEGKTRDDSAAVDMWQTSENGGCWAAGVGGSITGKGFHLGIVDDPIKNAQEAFSDTVRKGHKEWYDSTFATREEPGGAIVVILTRWHEDDLAGWLLSREKSSEDEPEYWHIVNFPAIAEEDSPKFPDTCTVEPDWRLPGEALCPERYPLSKLRKFQKNRYFWFALYQQRPTPADGDIFKAAWFQFYTQLPEHFPLLVLSVDASFKETDTGSFVVIQMWGVIWPNFYLIDQVRDRMGYIATVGAIKALMNRWRLVYGEPHAKLIEDKANGPAIIEQLDRDFPGIIPIEPQGGKLVRAHASSPFYQSGNIWLPAKHLMAWVEDHIDEFIAFPRGNANDQVDAATQFICWMAETGGMEVEYQSTGNSRPTSRIGDY